MWRKQKVPDQHYYDFVRGTSPEMGITFKKQYKVRNNKEIGVKELTQGLERQFSKKRSTATLLRALDNIKMTEDLKEYIKQFINLTYDRHLGEDELMYYFKQNLVYKVAKRSLV
jgi:hypothetical protein